MIKDDENPGQIELTILANPAYLCVARAAIRKALEISGFDDQDADGVTLALDEALTNVIRHSYGGPCEKPIIIKLSQIPNYQTKASALEIVVRDFGKHVDPKTIKSRDLNEVRPGGLGVHIIQTVMDVVEYSCVSEGGMQLRMLKLFQPTDCGEMTSDVKAGFGGSRIEKAQ